MSKAGQKLLEAAAEALESARCEHDLQPAMRRTWPKGFSRQVCKKCGVSIYAPLTNGQLGGEG